MYNSVSFSIGKVMCNVFLCCVKGQNSTTCVFKMNNFLKVQH